MKPGNRAPIFEIRVLVFLGWMDCGAGREETEAGGSGRTDWRSFFGGPLGHMACFFGCKRIKLGRLAGLWTHPFRPAPGVRPAGLLRPSSVRGCGFTIRFIPMAPPSGCSGGGAGSSSGRRVRARSAGRGFVAVAPALPLGPGVGNRRPSRFWRAPPAGVP